MCDPYPNPVDDKWYTLPEAQKKQAELVATMPTGTRWFWVDKADSGVVFTYPTFKPDKQPYYGETANSGEQDG